MRIVVNDIAASEGGAMSVLRDLHSDIINDHDKNEWIFLLGEKFIEESDNIKVLTFPKIKASWINRLKFDFISGKKIVNKLRPDVYLSLQNTATIGVNAPQYVFLHQPLPYQKEKKFSFFKIKEFKMAIYQHVIGKIYSILLKKTKAIIIVQTQWMKEHISRITNNRVLKVDTKINIDENSINKRINENKRNMKHFFYPASNIPYKNHDYLIKSFSKCKDKELRLFLTLSRNEIKVKDDRIILLGKIPREKVFDIYSKANLIFPSSIETLGLPLLEAQCFMGPILALETEFSKEALADYPYKYFFKHDDPNNLCYLIEKISTSSIEFNTDKIVDIKENKISVLNILKGENID